MSAPEISVIIATVNRPQLACRAIASVLADDGLRCEVLVIDQSPDERTRAAVRDGFGSDVRVKYHHSNVAGLSRARNRGVELAAADLLVFLDDDATADAGALRAYADVFRTVRPVPGIVGGRLFPEWEVPCPAWFPPESAHLLGLYDLGDERREFPPGHLPIGANFAMSKQVIQAIGGFDVGLGFDVGRRNSSLAGEDSSIALKALEAGHKLIYEPRASARHLVSRSKLQRRYFLQRQYWAGRSFVELHRRLANGQGSFGLRIVSGVTTHLTRRAADESRNVALRRSDASQRLMSVMGAAATAVGICVESVGGIVTRAGRTELTP